MRILIPMAGEGRRFKEIGYVQNKAILPMIYRKTGEKCPMVVCSVKDLPGIEMNGENIAFIMRDFHFEQGVDVQIRRWYRRASFFSVKELTEGQACTCLLAEEFIAPDDELLIAACDNGIEYDRDKFEQLRKETDVIVFTYRNDPRVEDNPDAFGWVCVGESNEIISVSVKKHISNTPQNDHAIVATFWFREGKIFTRAAEKMIEENDRVNNEFYVDEIIKHVKELGYRAHVFEVQKFLNYGSPEDYENYWKMIRHFKEFVDSDDCRRIARWDID